MTRVEVNLIGEGYTEDEALVIKAEVIAYATTKNLKGAVIIVQTI